MQTVLIGMVRIPTQVVFTAVAQLIIIRVGIIIVTIIETTQGVETLVVFIAEDLLQVETPADFIVEDRPLLPEVQVEIRAVFSVVVAQAARVIIVVDLPAHNPTKPEALPAVLPCKA